MSIRFSFLSILVVFILFSGCKTSKKIVKKRENISKIESFAFDFVTSSKLEYVLRLAKKENKLVFVDLYTTWCLPCKMMDENVYNHKATADIINANFISYRVDAEKSNGPNVAFNYAAEFYPTLLFLDAQGNVLEKKSGSVMTREFLDLAQSALAKTTLN